MTIEKAFGFPGIFRTIGLVIIGAIWFFLTIFILCVMEVRASFSSCKQRARKFSNWHIIGSICILARVASSLGGGEQQAL